MKDVAAKAEAKIEKANDGQTPTSLDVAKKGFGLAAKGAGKLFNKAAEITDKYAIPGLGSQSMI